mmetsp:Transcript_1349/g.1917  ORF Transcript_1349/g.1917 Transcript_1349/m.1917 type:complete len:245 (-) Transcript_1349:10-744(-)
MISGEYSKEVVLPQIKRTYVPSKRYAHVNEVNAASRKINHVVTETFRAKKSVIPYLPDAKKLLYHSHSHPGGNSIRGKDDSWIALAHNSINREIIRGSRNEICPIKRNNETIPRNDVHNLSMPKIRGSLSRAVATEKIWRRVREPSTAVPLHVIMRSFHTDLQFDVSNDRPMMRQSAGPFLKSTSHLVQAARSHSAIFHAGQPGGHFAHIPGRFEGEHYHTSEQKCRPKYQDLLAFHRRNALVN